MSQYLPFIIGAAILLVAGIAYAASKKKDGKDYTVPAPATLRTDLLFGYYGTYGNQIAETTDHVNLVWLWDFLDVGHGALG